MQNTQTSTPAFNIDNFTLGELKQIAALVNTQLNPQLKVQSAPQIQPDSKVSPHPFIGKYCIARCYSAGVHAGTVVSVDGETCVLADSRRLWSWKAQDGIALSGVAQTGVQQGCKIDVVNPELYLTGVCELIPCSTAAKDSINAYKK